MTEKFTNKANCAECKDLPEGEVVAGHNHVQINPDTNNISKTYSEVADEFLLERVDILAQEPVRDFAKHLDSMPNLMPHLELMVMRKAREIDREMMLLLIAEIPAEKVKEIAREVTERHKHTKTSIT